MAFLAVEAHISPSEYDRLTGRDISALVRAVERKHEREISCLRLVDYHLAKLAMILCRANFKGASAKVADYMLMTEQESGHARKGLGEAALAAHARNLAAAQKLINKWRQRNGHLNRLATVQRKN